MSTYLIGDIHGCFKELKILLEQVKFNPKLDTLWLTGDLVARGSNSLEVLRMISNFRDSVRMVLGNHDLNLLAVHAGICKSKKQDQITTLLEATDADKLINWLRLQPMLQIDEAKKIIMTHAGIPPQWDLITACQCAQEIETLLRSNNYRLFLSAIMDNNGPNNWSVNLNKLARLKFSANAFTRMRYCFPNGTLEMNCKDNPEKLSLPLLPWFKFQRKIPQYSIAFGHWASLMGKGTPTHIYGLDTGCCWGGKLTLLCWENKRFTRVSFQETQR